MRHSCKPVRYQLWRLHHVTLCLLSLPKHQIITPSSLIILHSLFPWLLLFLFSPSPSPSYYAFSSATTVACTRRWTRLHSTSCPTRWTGRPQCRSTMMSTKKTKKMSRAVLVADHCSGGE